MTFSYAGPSVSAAFVAGVFNDAWTLAAQKSLDALARTDAAIALATAAPVIATVPAISVLTPTAPGAPAALSASDAQAIFEQAKNSVTGLLTSNFTSFLATHFPIGTYLARAQAWIENALQNGGSGINSSVEAQLWERERSRILKDAARATDELTSTWAARRFPTPPGALTFQQMQVSLAAAEKIGENSREQAIQSWKAELDNVHFAVEKAIALRVAAVGAAGEYIRTLALGPQIGAQLASAIIDAQARMASVVSEFFRSQVAAAELTLRASQVNAELQVRVGEANQMAAIKALEQRVNTAIAAAQTLATQAAAALNALHAQSGISANESL